MSYEIIIKRGTFNPHEEPSERITHTQWVETITADPSLEFDIGLESTDYNYAELINEDDESWMQYEENGTISSDGASPLFIYHMLKIAVVLRANVIGEEADIYELYEHGFRSRMAYPEGDRLHHWLLKNTDDGLEFVSEDDD